MVTRCRGAAAAGGGDEGATGAGCAGALCAVTISANASTSAARFARPVGWAKARSSRRAHAERRDGVGTALRAFAHPTSDRSKSVIDHHAPWNAADRYGDDGLAAGEIDDGDVVAEAV